MSAAISFSAVAGYVFCSHELAWGAITVFIGVLLLAGAATTLNQYQEREFDALMTRTKDRPLPSGQMKPSHALLLAIILGISGTLVLYFFTTPLTAGLGLFNILWYNAVYTPLKRKTAFVVIIGAVTGAIPPMMGWTAAGGYILSPEILLIALFMFLWQIPHFFLLLLRYKEDYEKAGFVSVIAYMSDRQVQFIVFTWIAGTSASTLFFPMFEVISGPFLITGIILLNILLILSFYKTTFNKNFTFNIGKAFGSLYLYQVLVLVILIIQALK